MKSVLIILALFDLSVSAAPQGARAPVVAGAIQAGARAAAQRYQNEPDPSTMATYYFGLLRRGPQWTPERSAETERIQREHMANIRRLAEMGKLIAAGPFADGGDLRGVFIFQAGSVEEARRLVDTDPAVQAGRLACEIHPWYGPKGIGSKYAAWKKENPQAQDKMVTYQLGALGLRVARSGRRIGHRAGECRSARNHRIRLGKSGFHRERYNGFRGLSGSRARWPIRGHKRSRSEMHTVQANGQCCRSGRDRLDAAAFAGIPE